MIGSFKIHSVGKANECNELLLLAAEAILLLGVVISAPTVSPLSFIPCFPSERGFKKTQLPYAIAWVLVLAGNPRILP
jgi:hypothetical protein